MDVVLNLDVGHTFGDLPQERRILKISEWRSHIFPAAHPNASDTGSTRYASASGSLKAPLGGRWKIASLPVRMLIIGAG